MQCVLGVVIAVAAGLLAVGVVTRTARCAGATLWQYSHLARGRAYAAVRPISKAVGARANGSQEEVQGCEAQPQRHDQRPESRPASSLTPPEDGVWKVLTFVCYVPPLSAVEKQRLLAAWRDGQHAGAGAEHA